MAALQVRKIFNLKSLCSYCFPYEYKLILNYYLSVANGHINVGTSQEIMMNNSFIDAF